MLFFLWDAPLGPHRHTQVAGGQGQVVGDLQAQLSGRHYDQGARGAVRGGDGGVIKNPIENRNAETQSLAHTSARLADNVGALQRDGQGVFLDGEGARNVGRGQSLRDFRGHAERAEGWAGGRGSRRPRGHQHLQHLPSLLDLIAMMVTILHVSIERT